MYEKGLEGVQKGAQIAPNTHPTIPIYLRYVLHTPNVVKNLVSIPKFYCDTKFSIEFEPFVFFFFMDLKNGKLLTRHSSSGDLYPFINQAKTPNLSFFYLI